MAFTTLDLDVADGVAHITLSRPEAHNSLTLQQGEDLEAATAEIAHNGDVRAILLDAEGPSFHVGGDLKYFNDAPDMPVALRHLTTLAHAAAERLSRGPAPVVIAVQGTAAGGGMSLVLGGDIVLAAESASFTMAYTAAGLTPDLSSTWYLPRLVGLRRAQELIFTNRRLSATEAKEWGLVTDVVADDDLADRAMATARQLAAGPTRAFAGAKALLRSAMQQPLEAQMADESQWIATMAETEDAQGGIAAFVAKERPTFQGR
ncbi:enoyl-CoA hydratase/isomerase family protein [Euzebya tangerina]|uniref:enoyl-CoA hydratase/isomerase family protein n=1 Tax=Euzebya tangerina TaxID=591198 RepID=UPI000E30FC61|nr:enoyl-CoA hydratase-related protein [Euzebya tangerina]